MCRKSIFASFKKSRLGTNAYRPSHICREDIVRWKSLLHIILVVVLDTSRCWGWAIGKWQSPEALDKFRVPFVTRMNTSYNIFGFRGWNPGASSLFAFRRFCSCMKRRTEPPYYNSILLLLLDKYLETCPTNNYRRISSSPTLLTKR